MILRQVFSQVGTASKKSAHSNISTEVSGHMSVDCLHQLAGRRPFTRPVSV